MALSRWSGGQLSTFSVIQNKFHDGVDRYRISFKVRVKRMREIADELQKVTTEYKETRERSAEGLKAGVVTAYAGLGLAAHTGSFTGGLSLAIYGAATAGSLTSLHHSKTGLTNKEKMAAQQELTAEFWMISKSARKDLKRMRKVCEDILGLSEGAEREEIIKLEIGILKDFLRKTQRQISATGHHVKAAADKYQEALIELKAIKRTITAIDRNSR